MDILEKNQYHTDDPHVKELINEEIRKQIAVNLGQGDLDPTGKNKKGKSAHEQTLLNLRNTDGKFKYLWGEGDDVQDYDYQQQENRRKRESEMELIEPPRYKVIGWISERGSKLKKRPILRMSDLYLSHNPKIRRLINRVFDRHIYGRAETKKEEGDVIVSRSACNATQLQQILKNYEGHQEDYGFDNQQMRLNQRQLEDFIIQRGQSKQNYFLFYKNEEPKNVTFNIKNNPLHSNTFIKQLHNDVRRLQQRYSRQQQIEQSEEQVEKTKQQKKQGEQKKAKQYFGQFKQLTRQKSTQKFIIEDTFESKVKSTDQIVNSIIDYYSFIDNEVLDQKYLQSLPENDKLELNLANPHFFQPKLHTILHKQKEFFQQQQYKAKLAEANKGNMLDMSLISGRSHKKSKMMSGFEGEGNQNGEREDEQLTIQKVIETEMKNVYKQPLKHSDIAIKYDCIKFTFQEECFANLHRFNFPFHEHLLHGKIRLEIVPHKNRKAKPNGLVINSQMKQSNDKFSRKQDISLTRGQYVLIQYIEENPLLLSDVGMCERMIIQVNYLDVLEKVKQEQLQIKSFEEMEEERQKRVSLKNLSFESNCQVWRKCIRSIFGDYGKQFFWEQKNNGKLIGVPEGPGVILMESNLATVPIVRKKPATRDFLLVREGKRWVIRKIENIYTSGQIEPHKKVFCPGSRTHTEFKGAYLKAYVMKHVKQYGSVNFDQLKITFKSETENGLRKVLKSANTVSKDSKVYRQALEDNGVKEYQLIPEQICIYQRMQKSLCELKEVGISDIKSNQKMKNVLKQFNKIHYLNPEKIAIARMIREQLQLTSWYLTQSFIKFKNKTSKIEINGFADPTNGRGGYSFINKPQKQRTSKEDMEERGQKPKANPAQDLRKLKVDDSKEMLRQMGHNEDQIDYKGRWQLINILKNKQGTDFSRKQRETKNKKIENQKKEINKNFNRLLAYLNDETEEPAFDYSREKKNKLQDYIIRERDYIQKIKRKYGRPQSLNSVKEELQSDDSDQDN